MSGCGWRRRASTPPLSPPFARAPLSSSASSASAGGAHSGALSVLGVRMRTVLQLSDFRNVDLFEKGYYAVRVRAVPRRGGWQSCRAIPAWRQPAPALAPGSGRHLNSKGRDLGEERMREEVERQREVKRHCECEKGGWVHLHREGPIACQRRLLKWVMCGPKSV